MRNLRHGSLQMGLKNIQKKFETCICYGFWENQIWKIIIKILFICIIILISQSFCYISAYSWNQ